MCESASKAQQEESPAPEAPPTAAIPSRTSIQSAPPGTANPDTSVTASLLRIAQGPRNVAAITALLHLDTTKPSSSNVKVAQSLMRDGRNVKVWAVYVINAGIAKECVECFQSPIPGTRADAAGLMLITTSTPEAWGPALASMPSAFDALQWVLAKFQDGHDLQINRELQRQLATERMTREQSFEQYMAKK